MCYRLDEDHQPIPVDVKDPEFLTLMEDAEKRRVGFDVVGDYHVSTVFLGFDHRFSLGGPPLLFETMIFPKDSELDLHCERYETWDEAVAGHEMEIGRAHV